MPDNITATRRGNAIGLFQRFAESQVRAGAAPKGLEQAFAQRLQISPSMWSQIKSSRPIGDKLARQIEVACAAPPGWLDEEQQLPGMSPPGRPKGEYRRAQPGGTPVSAAEQQFLGLALSAWRATNAEGRKRLKLALRDVPCPAPSN